MPVFGFATGWAVEFAIGRPVIGRHAFFEDGAAFGTIAGVTEGDGTGIVEVLFHGIRVFKGI